MTLNTLVTNCFDESYYVFFYIQKNKKGQILCLFVLVSKFKLNLQIHFDIPSPGMNASLVLTLLIDSIILEFQRREKHYPL